MKKLDEITIADLMPDSISRDAQVSATARAIDPQLRLVSEALGKPLILYSIDDLNEGVLEHLAVQYDVTAWDSAWPIERKRAVLKTAIADKRKMGTRGAVQRAIETIAPVATITEWWEANPPETPHTFRIDVLQDGSPVDAETQADVIAQVNEAKPVRSHFTFNVGQMLGGDLYFAGVLRAIAYARVRDSGIVTEQMGIQAGVLAAMRGMSIRRILAETEMGDLPWSSLDFLLVNGETGKITRGANIFDIARAKTGQFTVDAAGDIVWVEGIPEYEEIVLYMPGGSGVTYESQYGVTSGYTGDPNSRYLYPLYSDPECTIPASYDATKRYEAGYYHYQTGEWTVKPIQTVTDMPSSTVSQFSDKTTAEILHNDNGVVKLWAIHNYVSSYPPYVFSYGSNPVSFRFRLYDAPEPVVPTTTVIAWLWLSQYGGNNFNINTGGSLPVYTRGDGLRLPYASGYTYELIDLFYDYRGTVYARNVDATKFHLGDDGYGVRVYNDSAGLIYTVGAAQVRITGTNIIVAYFTSNGSSATGDADITSGIVKTLYDEAGTPIPYDSGATYQTLNILNYAGDENRTATFGNYSSTSDSVLKGYSNGNILAYKLFILKS